MLLGLCHSHIGSLSVLTKASTIASMYWSCPRIVCDKSRYLWDSWRAIAYKNAVSSLAMKEISYSHKMHCTCACHPLDPLPLEYCSHLVVHDQLHLMAYQPFALQIVHSTTSFSQFSADVIMDIQSIKAVIGRVETRGWWGIIDWSTTTARTTFAADEVDEDSDNGGNSDSD